MQTADWALVISIISAGIAAASFLWNIWSKFIYPKPVMRVSFSLVMILERETDAVIHVLRLEGTNMGPLMNALVLYNHGPFRDKRYALLSTLPHAPLSPDLDLEFDMRGGLGAGFPRTLKVGESCSFYIAPDHETLARGDY